MSGMLLIQSCTVAKLSSFPKSSDEIDFNKCPVDIENNKEPRRTSKTSNTYCIQKSKAYVEEDILRVINNAYKLNSFVVTKLDRAENCVFAERGLRTNEWNSIAAVYYKIDEQAGTTQLFILVKITQDATGGKNENRAKKIGLVIEKEL